MAFEDPKNNVAAHLSEALVSCWSGSENNAIEVLTEMHSLSCLVCLKELSIVCHFRPYTYVQHAPIAQCLTKLQSTLQAHLEDAQVQVAPLGDPIVRLPAVNNGFALVLVGY